MLGEKAEGTSIVRASAAVGRGSGTEDVVYIPGVASALGRRAADEDEIIFQFKLNFIFKKLDTCIILREVLSCVLYILQQACSAGKGGGRRPLSQSGVFFSRLVRKTCRVLS